MKRSRFSEEQIIGILREAEAGSCNLREARVILESWRLEYNERRPHSALGYRTPSEYAGRKTNRFDGGCAPPNPAPLAAAGVRGEHPAGANVPCLTPGNPTKLITNQTTGRTIAQRETNLLTHSFQDTAVGVGRQLSLTRS